jgi:hypothetical protein
MLRRRELAGKNVVDLASPSQARGFSALNVPAMEQMIEVCRIGFSLAKDLCATVMS